MIKGIVKKYFKILISTLLITALGCALMVGLSSAHKSLNQTLNNYIDEYNYPDAQITTNVQNISKLTFLNKIEGVKEYNTRVVFDTPMISPTGKYLSARLFSYNEKDFQKMYVWSSISDDIFESVLLEYNFAHDNNIKVGDKVKFKIKDEYREYTVSKIVSLPETLSMQITDNSWGFNSDFGFVYFSVDLLKQETIKEKNKMKEDLQKQEIELDEKEQTATNTYNVASKELNDTLYTLENEYSNKKNSILENLGLLESNLNNLYNIKAELMKNISEAKLAKEKLISGINELTSTKNKLLEAQNALKEIDKNLNPLKDKYNVLASDDMKFTVQIMALLPENTPLVMIYQICTNVEEFLNLLDEYGINIDIDKGIYYVADNVSSISYKITDDYNYLNSASTKKLVDDIKNNRDVNQNDYDTLTKTINLYYRSLKNEDFETTYNKATQINGILYNYVLENKLINAAVSLKQLDNKITFRELLQNVNDCYEMASMLDNQDINNMTVKDFIKVYNETTKSLEEGISTLENKRNEIVKLLKENGVEEENLSSTIKNLDEQIKAANNKLSEVDNTITLLNSKLGEINNNTSLLEAQLSQIYSALNLKEQEFSNAKQLLLNKKHLLDTEWLNAKSEFSRARIELENAYNELKNKDGYEKYFNQILLNFDKDVDCDETLSKVINKMDDIEVKNSYTYDDSPVNNRINTNLEPIETMSIFMPIIFFIIILIVVFLFMSLLIKQCRREIGILRALGLETKDIRKIFSKINLLVSIFAIILGTIIGVCLMLYIGTYYKNFFPLPSFEYSLNIKMFIIAIISTISVSQIATLIASTTIGRIEPTEAMSRETPSDYELPKSLEVLTKKSSPLAKFNLISLFRNKLKFVLSVLVISASVMMIFSALSFIKSKNYLLDELYNKRINYDAQIFMNSYPEKELIKNIESLKGTSDIKIVDYYESKVSANGISDTVLINAIDTDNELVKVFDSKNKQIEIPSTGIVLEKHIADKLKVKKGDIVKIDDTELEVKEISNQSINRIQYISKEQAKALEDADYETILLNIEKNKHEDLLEILTKEDSYLYTVFTDLSYESNHKVFATYDIAAWIIIGFAIIVGFIIVINNAYTNLLEQKKKLCMLRSLGFQHKEISWNLFKQSILQWILSCIIGLPFGTFIAKSALLRLSTENREYVYANSIQEFLLTIILVLLYMIVSHVVTMKTFKTWDIASNVKDKE